MAGLGARSVLVTGANCGIGLELVRQLAAKPDPLQWIFACSREPGGQRGQVLRKLALSHSNLIVVKLEATNLASIKEAAALVETHLKGAGLNVLINSAAILTETTLETTRPEDMISGYTTNVVGPLMVSQGVYPLYKNGYAAPLVADLVVAVPEMMKWLFQQSQLEMNLKRVSFLSLAFLPLLRRAAQASGQKGLSCNKAAIINISSALGSVELAHKNYSKPMIPYRCSKAAVNMLTKCQALSYEEEGILCTVVHPGWVKTDMGTQQADLTVEESVQGILQVFSKLNDEHSGAFVNWKGKQLPW